MKQPGDLAKSTVPATDLAVVVNGGLVDVLDVLVALSPGVDTPRSCPC